MDIDWKKNDKMLGYVSTFEYSKVQNLQTVLSRQFKLNFYKYLKRRQCGPTTKELIIKWGTFTAIILLVIIILILVFIKRMRFSNSASNCYKQLELLIIS